MERVKKGFRFFFLLQRLLKIKNIYLNMLLILPFVTGCSQVGFSAGKDLGSIFIDESSKNSIHREFGLPYNSVEYDPQITLLSAVKPLGSGHSQFLHSKGGILVSEREDYRYQGLILDPVLPFVYGFLDVFTLGLAEFYLFPKSIHYVLKNRKTVTSFSVWYSAEGQYLNVFYGDFSTVGTNCLSQ